MAAAKERLTKIDARIDELGKRADAEYRPPASIRSRLETSAPSCACYLVAHVRHVVSDYRTMATAGATCWGRAQLACSDDACGGVLGLQGRVTLTLAAGQGIVIVVDSAFPGDDGNYQLAITPQ